jgi:hypothetical protein
MDTFSKKEKEKGNSIKATKEPLIAGSSLRNEQLLNW